jgi:hypothetical protein
VHVYTSPNLVRLNERFRIGRAGGGKLVTDDELSGALAECEAANGDAPITVFEIETAAAFRCSRGIRPMFFCSKWGSAAGSTPPMSSSARSPA